MTLSKAQNDVVNDIRAGKTLVKVVQKYGHESRAILQEENQEPKPVRFIVFRKLQKYGFIRFKFRENGIEYFELSY